MSCTSDTSLAGAGALVYYQYINRVTNYITRLIWSSLQIRWRAATERGLRGSDLLNSRENMVQAVERN
jgi:hypothetical protein